jgi:hypothetical protein
VVADVGRRVHHADAVRALAHPRALSVQIAAADVTIVGGPGAGATVHAHESWSGSQRPSGTTAVRAARLLLSSRCPASPNLHLWRFGAFCSVRYQLRTPAATPLHVSMGTGELHVTGVSGAFSATTGAGDLYASALRSPRTTVHLDVGEAHLSFARTPSSVRVQIGVGDAYVVVPRGRYDIDARASVGEVRIGPGIVQDPSSRRTIVVDSSVGDVSVDARG